MQSSASAKEACCATLQAVANRFCRRAGDCIEKLIRRNWKECSYLLWSPVRTGKGVLWLMNAEEERAK